mgnify:CR=1 FL=1
MVKSRAISDIEPAVSFAHPAVHHKGMDMCISALSDRFGGSRVVSTILGAGMVLPNSTC